MKLQVKRLRIVGAIFVGLFSVTAFYYFVEPRLSHKVANPLLKNETKGKRTHTEKVTVLTMFFTNKSSEIPWRWNVNHYKKVTAKMYLLSTWGWLTNRVLSFFDDDTMIDRFTKIRSPYPDKNTQLIKVSKDDLTAFQNWNKLRGGKQLWMDEKRSGYKSPDHLCALHAKFDLIRLALEMGIVETKYLAWVDMGYIGHVLSPDRHLSFKATLEVPENFNSSCVGMSEVTPRQALVTMTPRDLIKNNRVWVSTGFILGSKTMMQKFVDSYSDVFEDLLQQNLASTDEQVVGAMFSPAYIHRQAVSVMTYKCKQGQFGLNVSDSKHFCLGSLCLKASENT